MLKSTILSTVAFVFVFVGWAITPVQAHIGNPCPHKDTSHSHCDNVPTEIMVEDSSDPPKQVGKYLGITDIEGHTEVLAEFQRGHVSVAFDVNGSIIRLLFNRGGFILNEPLYFLDDDCGDSGGDALLEVLGLFITAHAVVAPPGNTLYVERPGGGFANRVASSELDPNGVCNGGAFQKDTVIVDSVVDLDTIYTPPFKLVGDAPNLPLP